MKGSTKLSRFPMFLISIASVLGMIVSVYAYYVETKAHSDPTYRALCDFSETMSCSKVLSSKYGTGFGLVELVLSKDSILNQPNSVLGMLFYIGSALLAVNNTPLVSTVQLAMSSLAIVGCIYLAYILVFILGDLCVVCVTTYILNTLIMVGSVLKYKNIAAIQETSTTKFSNGKRKKGTKKNK